MAGVELLFGPMLIGVYLNTILYGVLIVQTFIYYQTYKNDKAWIRYLVLYLFIVDTLNTGFDIGMMYEPLVIRYATPRATKVVPVMLEADPIVMVMISTPIQLFVAWRIKVISKSKLLTSIIVFFAICSLIGGIAATVAAVIFVEYDQLQRFSPTIITWLVSSATADVIITCSLVYHLYHRKTGVRATDDIINRIMRLTIQTGMITAVFAALDVIIFLAVPETTLNFIWDFALSKLYTNSLLSTLNARAGWSNLTGNDRHNVLFGDDSGQTMTKPMKSERGSNPQKIITGVYELEPRSMSVSQSTIKNTPDLESGISVTRVVEHLEDPLPRSKSSTEVAHI